MALESAIASDFNTAPARVTLAASTPTQVTATRTSAKRGIVVNADTGNNTPIYFGDSAVDASHYMAVIQANDPPIMIPLSDASKLYAYSTGTAQKYGWSAL